MTKTERINLIREKASKIGEEALALRFPSFKLDKEVGETVDEISDKCMDCVDLEATMENVDEVFEKVTNLEGLMMADLTIVIIKTS